MTSGFNYIPSQGTDVAFPLEHPEGRPPLGPKALSRVELYMGFTDRLYTGERLVLGGDNKVEDTKADKWYEGMIREMSKRGHLPEDITAYIIRQPLERVHGYTPVPHYFALDKATLIKELTEKGVLYARVAGSKAAFRSDVRMDRQIDASNLCIANAGDLSSMREVLHIIDSKFKGNLVNYPLVIENTLNADGKGFWDELLRGIKILQKPTGNRETPSEQRAYIDRKKLAEHFGIYISESREETIDTAQKLSKKLPEPLQARDDQPVLPEGATIFLATGTPKKYREFESIMLAQGVKVKFRSIGELVDTYKSPKEDQHTYEANAAKKIKAAFDAWNEMGDEGRVQRLKDLGLKKSQIFILAEDSGYHFHEPNLIYEEEFNGIRHLVDPKAPFPGTETGPGIYGSGGIQGFVNKVKHISEHREKFDNRVEKKCSLALAPLEQTQSDKIDMFSTCSEVHGHIKLSPLPAVAPIEIDNYLVPHNMPDDADHNKTEAQLGDKFYKYYSPRALAWKAMASELAIPMDSAFKSTPDYAPNFVAGIVTDNSSYTGKEEAKKLERKVFEDGFGAINLDSSINRADDIQRHILSKADGIVFHLDPARADEDYWENLYKFTSVIVAEQTGDKMKFTKPFYVVDPGGKTYKKFYDLVYDFHDKGTVPQDPGTLFKVVDTLDEAAKRLEIDRLHYRRYPLPDYMTQKEPNPIIDNARSDDGKFHVAIFCSALNENAKYTEETRNFTEKLIKSNFGIVSGAGMAASMEQVTKTAYKMRNTCKAQHKGSNAPHIQLNEGNATEYMTQFLLARHIYERMEYMMENSDAFAILAGGTGTVQELALLALLKKRSLDGDHYGEHMMGGKDIVIVNSEAHDHNGRFYDKLRDIIPKGDLDKLGIHFVDDIHTAHAELARLRDQKNVDHYAAMKMHIVGMRHNQNAGRAI